MRIGMGSTDDDHTPAYKVVGPSAGVPQRGALQYWTDPPRCRVRSILDDGKRHQCHRTAGHDDKHACPCGQEYPQS
jgi:hypothetical protein